MVERVALGNNLVKIDAQAHQECVTLHNAFIQRGDELLYILRREIAVAAGRGIVAQCLLHILEHVHIVHQDTTSLAGEYTVGACDSLHQRVALHRLVEIQCRERRHIKSRQPHGADEHQAQRVVLVLEAVLDILAVGRDLVHLLAVLGDVQSVLHELLGLLGLLADDDGHLNAVHVVEHSGEFVALLLGGGFVAFLDDGFYLLVPVMHHLVVHLHGGVLVDAHHHAFAQEAATREMMGDILGDLVQALVTLDHLKDAR